MHGPYKIKINEGRSVSMLAKPGVGLGQQKPAAVDNARDSPQTLKDIWIGEDGIPNLPTVCRITNLSPVAVFLLTMSRHDS